MQTFLNIASDRDRVVIAKRESSNSPARQQPANTISHDTKNKGTLFDDDSTPPQTTTTRDTSSTGMHQSPTTNITPFDTIFIISSRIKRR